MRPDLNVEIENLLISMMKKRIRHPEVLLVTETERMPGLGGLVCGNGAGRDGRYEFPPDL